MKEKIKSIFSDFLAIRFSYKIEKDEDRRRYKMMQYISMTLAAVSSVMFILNVLTKKEGLMISTLLFTVFNVIFSIYLKVRKEIGQISYILFLAVIMVLFAYFIITGGTEGFSPIWMIILPTVAYMAFGMKMGMFYSILVMTEIIFFFYVPIGKELLQWEYTTSFHMRFPLVYFTSCIIGFFIEARREYI